MNISTRLVRLLKSVANDKMDQFSQILEQRDINFDEMLEEWEKKYGLYGDSNNYSRSYENFESHSEQKRANPINDSAYPRQVVDDLHLFGLKPPVSYAEVKKARNEEIKKFHPDKFLNDPEKMETAKQIVQIYNAAFERLEKSLK